MIKSRKDFIGAICIKMCPTGEGSVQPVGQEKCRIGTQKHLCDNTMLVTQWSALG